MLFINELMSMDYQSSLLVCDIVLPGDMKVILNQVVEAQKVAKVNLI